MTFSLASVLTTNHLRTRAGGLVFARGEDYWLNGRVEACAASGEALEGVVIGGARYRVQLAVDTGNAVARCTCPVGDSFCKHAVALGLAYLTRQAPRMMSDGAAGGFRERGFATRAELDAWAAEHQIHHALNVVGDMLVARLPPAEVQRYGLRYLLERLPLRDLASRDVVSQVLGVRPLEGPVAAAAVHALEQAAAVVRAGCEEERARPERHADPVIAPLWSRLVEARRAVRPHAGPRSRAWRATSSWKFEPAGCALTWKETERIVRAAYTTIGIATRLTTPGGGEVWLECSCGAPGARCAHSLALIDTTLDRLEDPALAAEARQIAEDLLQPGWARLLKELDARGAIQARPRAPVEVWWHVEYELGLLTLSPVVKRQLKRGTMSAGSPMSVARLLDDHHDLLPEVDLQIADHLAVWVPPARGPGNRASSTYPVRAFQALVGHPRVITEWSEEPIEVARAPLGFAARADGEHICLEPAIEGAPMNPRTLAALLDAFAPGEPLVLEEPERGRYLLIEVSDEARRLWGLLQKHGARFPPESHTHLLDRLARLEARLPLALPPALKGKQLAAEAVTVARLRLLPDVTLELELLIRPGEGAPLYQPGSGPRDVLLARGGERGYVRRALSSESEHARSRLAGLPLDGAEEGPPFCYRVGDPEAALRLVAALETPPPGLCVEWLDKKPVIARSVGADALRVHVERRRDWFGIAGEIKIEAGRLELAVLLDAARRQQRFVKTGEGAWIELADTLRQRLAAIADQTFAAQNHLEVSPGAVPAVHALAEAGAQVDAAPDWQQLTARLAASSRISP
ncbi:MAG TPA: SWIM zinc finger family protein, partial [Kofleriaceae bacterium]|nr:SWIM zinc finger family protein [Kofleriaceae bacterium]